MAHTLSVLYYGLTEPERPLIPEPGTRWQSVWHANDAAEPALEQMPEPLADEQQRKFDERETQWGG